MAAVAGASVVAFAVFMCPCTCCRWASTGPEFHKFYHIDSDCIDHGSTWPRMH